MALTPKRVVGSQALQLPGVGSLPGTLLGPATRQISNHPDAASWDLAHAMASEEKAAEAIADVDDDEDLDLEKELERELEEDSDLDDEGEQPRPAEQNVLAAESREAGPQSTSQPMAGPTSELDEKQERDRMNQCVQAFLKSDRQRFGLVKSNRLAHLHHELLGHACSSGRY